MTHNHELLEMALMGFEVEKQRLDEKITEIRDLLGGGQHSLNGRAANSGSEIQETAAPKKRRKMTAKARKAISAAQKKRWADFHKNQAA